MATVYMTRRIKRGDSIRFNCTVLDGDEAMNLGGFTVEVAIKKTPQDASALYSGTSVSNPTEIDIVDTAGGVVYVQLPVDTTQNWVPGEIYFLDVQVRNSLIRETCLTIYYIVDADAERR